jgi:DNA helicase IV
MNLSQTTSMSIAKPSAVFCHQILQREEKVEFESFEKLVEETADALIESPMSDKFETIIVDEAQDFPRAFGDVIELMQIDRLRVFYDPHQIIHNDNSLIEHPVVKKLTPLNLTENCRNTKQIAEYAYSFLPKTAVNPSLYEKCVDGKKTVQLDINDEDEQLKAVVAQLERLIGKQGLSPAQVVVLCDSMKTLEALEKHKGLQKKCFAKQLNLFSTHQFKGLEADCIIYLSNSGSKIPENKRAYLSYVASSRGKALLVEVRVK